MSLEHDGHRSFSAALSNAGAARRAAMRADLQAQLVADQTRRQRARQSAALLCGAAAVVLLSAVPVLTQSTLRGTERAPSSSSVTIATSVEGENSRVRIVGEADRDNRVRTVADGDVGPRIVVARDDEAEGRFVVENGDAARHVRVVGDPTGRLVILQADDELLLALREAGVPAAVIGDSGARTGNLVFLDPGQILDAGRQRR